MHFQIKNGWFSVVSQTARVTDHVVALCKILLFQSLPVPVSSKSEFWNDVVTCVRFRLVSAMNSCDCDRQVTALLLCQMTNRRCCIEVLASKISKIIGFFLRIEQLHFCSLRLACFRQRWSAVERLWDGKSKEKNRIGDLPHPVVPPDPGMYLLILLGVSQQQYERQKCERHQCEARSANANSAKETTARMRQKCEGQVCEGQECECDFSASGQNSEMIQIVRSRSFCLQDGVWFFFLKKNSLSLSQSLSG